MNSDAGSPRTSSGLRRLLLRGRRLLLRFAGLSDASGRLDNQGRRLADAERDLARIGPQVAALEARIEDLRHQLELPATQQESVVQASRCVEEVRREHERMRARVSAAVRFEERLERLEEQMTSESHPMKSGA